jgi:hypothetical protein
MYFFYLFTLFIYEFFYLLYLYIYIWIFLFNIIYYFNIWISFPFLLFPSFELLFPFLYW